MQDDLFIRDLGNGLILRHASPRDAAALSKFNGSIHGSDPADARRVAAMTHDLLAKPHPTMTARDFTIVEEPASGRIVSSLNLIPQTWAYEGVPFGVGRVELVGTLAEFRKRGLVRTQFDEVHQWCEERGLPVQIITGIPYFYRQFGYEMAVDLSARRIGFEKNVPFLKKGEKETYRIRPATDSDLRFVAGLYAETQKRYAITCLRTLDNFSYELNKQHKDNPNRFHMRIIEDARGRRIGYFQHYGFLLMDGLVVVSYELVPGASWLDVTPAVARYLWETGARYAKRDGQTRTYFGLMLGASHPAYDVMGDDLPASRKPYSFYVRVANLPDFIRQIAPALEKRLAESLAAGYTGQLKVSFYTEGLRLVFTRGKLKTAEAWTPVANKDEGDAAFPGRTFLQLLFGYRSFEELRFAFPDCYWEHRTARVLLNALFPKRLSDVFPVF
jgi:hypothetical protein